jgi:hypothetical protein
MIVNVAVPIYLSRRSRVASHLPRNYISSNGCNAKPTLHHIHTSTVGLATINTTQSSKNAAW